MSLSALPIRSNVARQPVRWSGTGAWPRLIDAWALSRNRSWGGCRCPPGRAATRGTGPPPPRSPSRLRPRRADGRGRRSRRGFGEERRRRGGVAFARRGLARRHRLLRGGAAEGLQDRTRAQVQVEAAGGLVVGAADAVGATGVDRPDRHAAPGAASLHDVHLDPVTGLEGAAFDAVDGELPGHGPRRHLHS